MKYFDIQEWIDAFSRQKKRTIFILVFFVLAALGWTFCQEYVKEYARDYFRKKNGAPSILPVPQPPASPQLFGEVPGGPSNIITVEHAPATTPLPLSEEASSSPQNTLPLRHEQVQEPRERTILEVGYQDKQSIGKPESLRPKSDSQNEKRSSSSLDGTLYLSDGKTSPFVNMHISPSDAHDVLVTYNQESSPHSQKDIDLNEVSKIIFRDKAETANGSFVSIEITYKNGRTYLAFAGLYDTFVASSPNHTEKKKIPFYKIEQIIFQ